MEELFSYGPDGIKKFFKKNKIYILYTLIFHLVVVIVLLFARVEVMKRGQEAGIKLEMEKLTVEDLIEEEEMEVPAEWLEELMRQREAASNRAVNQNAESGFSQEISTDEYEKELLKQIEEARNQEDIEKIKELQAQLAAADFVPPVEESSGEDQGEFSGATTISYEFLEEPVLRKDVLLTTPVYRCQGSGFVKVEVSVAPDGTILNAGIKGPIQGNDKVCFEDAALAAARKSLFRVDVNAPSRQRAIISYTFRAQ